MGMILPNWRSAYSLGAIDSRYSSTLSPVSAAVPSSSDCPWLLTRSSVSLPRLSRRLGSSRASQSDCSHLAVPHRATRRKLPYRRAGILAIAAVVLAVLVGFGLGAVIGPPNVNVRAPSTSVNLTSANLSSHGQVLGQVMVSSGTPAWMFMTIDAGAWSSQVTCEVMLASGKVVKIGVFKLSDMGTAPGGAALPAPARDVRSARLVSPDGTVLASAKLAV